MESLSVLIKSFRSTECKYIRNYYIQKNTNNYTKRLQLFDLLRNEMTKDNEQTCKVLFNRAPDSAYCQLKEKLKKDLFDFLLFFPSRKMKTTAVACISVECHKLLLQAKLLKAHGVQADALQLLFKAHKLSVSYDLLDSRISVLEMLQSMPEVGMQQQKKYTQELTFCLVQLREITTLKQSVHGTDISEIKLLDKLHRDVDSACESSSKFFSQDDSSVNLCYWRYFSNIRMYKRDNRFYPAYLNGLRLIHLIESKPDLFLNEDKQQAYLEIAHMVMGGGYYKRAEFLIYRSLNFKEAMACETLKSFELLFILFFTRKEFEKSNQILNQVLEEISSTPVDRADKRWFFYLACQKFAREDYKGSEATMKRCGDLLKEKSGLFLEYKIVELLNTIALGDYDLLDYKIENLRKLIEYHRIRSAKRVGAVLQLAKRFVREDLASFGCEEEIVLAIQRTRPVNKSWKLIELIDAGEWIQCQTISSV